MTVRTSGTGGAMADNKAAEQPLTQELKEWAPLHHMMLQVPAKYQSLLAAGELRLTCVSAVDEHVLLGTNTGSVYWYDCVACTMERYRSEGQLNPVCRVSAVTSADHLLAAGHRSGDISVFLVPRLARGEVPDFVRITEKSIKKSLQFSVQAGHRAPITALTWSQNAARLFSGDQAGAVAVTEIDYVTESVTSRLVVREPSPVVQLQFCRLTLLVATRERSLLLAWPDGEPRQVGTKPRKSPAELGACFLETESGLTVLAARPSLKVVTADLDGQVSATISLKPTLETAGCVQLLYPVSVPAVSTPSPGRLLSVWPGAVALYDERLLLVVDIKRWEIVYRCEQLPAVLDVAAAGGAIFVLCSGRRLVRLAERPDNHPAVCENMRLVNGDLSFDDVMQDLKSAVPVTQVKTLLNSVSGQLERSGLLDVLSSRADAVSSLKSRVSSLVTGRLGSAVSRQPPAGLGSASSVPGVNASLRASCSSPDVRHTAGPPPAKAAATPAEDSEPIARQVRLRRRPGRRRPAAQRDSAGARSLDTVSLGGESTTSAGDAERRPSVDQRVSGRPPVDGRVSSGVPSDERVSSGVPSDERVSSGVPSDERVSSGVPSDERVSSGVPSDERVSSGTPADEDIAKERRVGPSRRVATTRNVVDPAEQTEVVGRTVGSSRDEASASEDTYGTAGPDRLRETVPVPLPAPVGPLDFTQFYPSEVRPSLQKSESQLEEELRDKERRLAALLGLEDLTKSPPAVPAPPPVPAPSTGSSATPSPPSPGVAHYRDMFLLGPGNDDNGMSPGTGGDPQPLELRPETESDVHTQPAPSYHSLFPFGEKRTVAPPPPRPPSADSETGEPRRHVAEVRSPSPMSTPPPPPPAAAELGTELTEDYDPASAGGWQPWDRQTAPSFVMTLSACVQYAVLTDPDARVFYAPATVVPAVWERLDYTACQVSVSHDGGRVWRLDEHGVAFSLADPACDRPRGSHWVKAATGVIQLSADTAAVWYIKRGGKLFVQRDLTPHRCASPELAVGTPEPIIHVTARSGVVWAVTASGSVMWRVGVSRVLMSGLGWEMLPVGPLKARATFLTDGEVGWLLDDHGRLHLTTGVSAALPRGMDGVWRRVLGVRSCGAPSGRQVAVMTAGAALRSSLAVEGGVAWFSDPGVMNIMTCRHHITGVRWEQFTPRGRGLCWSEVHAEGLYRRRGQLWTVSAKGQLYGGNGHDGDLQTVPLPERSCNVACVAAAPGTLWLLTAAGDVFVRQGVEQSPRGTDWARLDLLQMEGCRLVHLSVGAQSVWACDAAGRVLVRLGPTVARRSSTGLQPAWVPIDQPPGVRFTLVCVGPADQPVWALDSAGVPWRRCGLRRHPVVGTHWETAAGITADRLAISPAAVWARARSGLVHRWLEASRTWCRVPGSTRHVSASVSGELWVVHRDELYTLHELSLRPGRPVTPHCAARPPSPVADAAGSEDADSDRDWELVAC